MTTHFLDITQDHCPMTFVKTRLKLDELQDDDELEVLVGLGEPLNNLPKTVTEYGFTVKSITKITEESYKLLISKK